jgi:hypothetical protein
MSHSRLKEKLLAAVAILMYVWWISPIQEGSLLLALISGGTVQFDFTSPQFQASLILWAVTYDKLDSIFSLIMHKLGR